MRKLLVLPCFAGLCNRILFINKLCNLARADSGLEVTYYWSLLDSRGYPSKFTSFHDVFKADLNIKLLENEDTFKSIEPFKSKPEYADYVIIDDLMKMKTMPAEHFIRRSGCIGSEFRSYIKRQYNRNVEDLMVFNKNLLMSDATKSFYDKLEEKYLNIFLNRQIVFIRSNSDYKNKFNEMCRDKLKYMPCGEDLFYIHDSCDEVSYSNMVRHIPGITGENSFNMFDMSLSRTDRFVNIVALLFLCLKAKYEIVNFGGYSTYGTQMKINSKVVK